MPNPTAAIAHAERQPDFTIPQLTALEAGALLALVRLGMDVYRDGSTEPAALILDEIPKAAFDSLATKLAASQSREAA